MNRAQLFLLVLLFTRALVFAQDAETNRGLILIAIPDLENRGGLATAEIEQMSTLLRTEIIETGTFEVVEREQLSQILATQEDQESGLFDGSDAIEYGGLKSVRQLVLGSAGKLFGRLVITIRLVSAETGRIIFAETVYTQPGNVFDAVASISQGMARKAVDYTRDIPAEEMLTEIRDRLRRRDFVRASELLDAFVFQHGISDAVRSLRDEILPGLHEDYFRRARKARRQSDYRSATEYIGLAIAIRPTSDAYELRERILSEQEAHRRRQEELRRRAELERQQRLDAELATIALSPLDVLRGYYGALDTRSHRLAVVASWRDELVPEVPTTLGSVGVGYMGVLPRTDAATVGAIAAESVGYLAASVTYDRTADTPTATAALSMAPFSAVSFRLLNVFLTAGIEGGVDAEFSSALPAGYRVAPAIGARIVADVRIFPALGAFASVATSALLHGETAEQLWRLSVATGLVF